MNNYWDKPCAAHGLTSYRYRGDYGWVMVGAKDDSDAIVQVNRSLTRSKAIISKLERWDGSKYSSLED